MRTLLLFLALLAGPARAADLPVVKLTAGMHLISAELADTPGSRMQGLMHRRSLATNAGMLFVFDELDRHCMWMRNTLVPLSVAFLDESASVINIADMTPHSEQTHCAERPARYALEMNRGWFAERGIRAGFTLRGVPGAPKK